MSHTILTYQLESSQVDVLQQCLPRMSIHVTMVAASHIDCIFTTAPFLVFLNFANVLEQEQQNFFAQWRELRQAGQSMPLTYVFNSQVIDEKIPNLFINRELFGEKEKLKLLLLQETKNREGKGRGNLDSQRIERILVMYKRLMVDKSLKKSNRVRSRLFLKDLSVVKLLLPDVTYEKSEQNYKLQAKPDKAVSGQVLSASKIPARLKRVLLIYQQLLYEGWITKAVVDTLCEPVSLRMFQRDLLLINWLDLIYYDMKQEKYILERKLNPKDMHHRLIARGIFRL